MKLLVLDNYDSFTYNLVQYVQEILGYKVPVVRNDAIDLDAVEEYDAIILSPGPGVPADAGIMPELIKRYGHRKAILGVCLGHQAIGEAYGGTIHNLKNVFHGVETPIAIVEQDDFFFKDIPNTFIGGRYHSWVVERATLPDCLEITAVAEDKSIMAMKHKIYNVRGMQFHPESVMTECGKQILRNWIEAQQGILAEREKLEGAIA